MPKQKWKRPGAHKHGVFSATAILPGEDEREFEELHSALVEEWKPAGATEEDAVLSIAKAVWRKRRVQKFLEVRLTINTLDPGHPSYRENLGLRGLAMVMEFEPETAFQEYASRYLGADKIKYLEQKFPRSNFRSALEWANAVYDEIKSLLATPSLIGLEHEQLVSACTTQPRISRAISSSRSLHWTSASTR